jgi:hypothetical protein
MTGDVEPVVTWGADFVQKVAISGLGTIGALAIAVGLFYLKRWHDRRDEAEKGRQARQRQLTDDLLADVRTLRDQTIDWADMVKQTWQPLSVVSNHVFDKSIQLADSELSTFCREYARFINHYLRRFQRQDEEGEAIAHEVNERGSNDETVEKLAQLLASTREGAKEYFRVASAVPTSLLLYVERGKKLPFALVELPANE